MVISNIADVALNDLLISLVWVSLIAINVIYHFQLPSHQTNNNTPIHQNNKIIQKDKASGIAT